MQKVLTEQFLKENRVVMLEFGNWYNDTNKANTTQVTLASFFDIGFELQLGYYLEWLGTLGVYVSSYVEPIRNDLMLKLVYAKDKNLRFHYHDLDEVNTSHFKNSPLEAYELLVATFIYQSQYPF